MHNRQWIGDQLWYLLNLPKDVLREVFPNHKWESLKSKRKLYRRYLRENKIMPPRRPKEYYEGESPDDIRQRLEQPLGETVVSQVIDEETRQLLHKKLDQVIDDTNINPRMVKGFRLSSWDGLTKNQEGEAEIHKLAGIQLIAEAKDFEPKWPAITQIDYQPVPTVQETKKYPKGQHTAFILPDTQIGYRKLANNEVHSFHDEQAISAALSVLKDVRPNQVILLGDLLDLPAFGRYEQTEDYAHTTNMALQYACNLLDTIRSLVGKKAEIIILEGNHERRIEKQNKSNMLANFSLRQEGDVSNFPILSIPHLLNLEKRNVKYVEGYPAGNFWLNERLQVIHGHRVNSSGSTAAKIAKEENVSTILGHIHRIEQHMVTSNVYNGGKTNAAYSTGCLCKIDGSVPSAKGSTKLDGSAVKNYENWQQGFGVVSYGEGNAPFTYEQGYIDTFNNYETTYRGKVYQIK